VVVGPVNSERRGQFFAQVFGHQRGFLCLAKKKPGTNILTQEYFRYPENLDDALFWIDRALPNHDLYFCAQLLSKQKRIKENVTDRVGALWADLDNCHPDTLLVKPSIALESSPGRYQALWRLEEPIAKDLAERLSHAIALYHKDDGVDQSEWDLTQFLRIPHTWNCKYGDAEHPTVKVPAAKTGYYRLEDFTAYDDGHQDTGEVHREPVPDLDGSPPVGELLGGCCSASDSSVTC
jgi:hypothetical protein